MVKKGLALGILATALLLGGCSDDSSPTPFDQSIQKIDPRYGDTPALDRNFLSAVESAGIRSTTFTDEERIKYGKVICTLLDDSPNAREIVETYSGEEQVVSDAAIQVYCPHHLE